jgi:hypothetical protein
METGESVSVLVSIESRQRYYPWKYNRADKMLCGSIDNLFYVRMKAYFYEHGTKRVQKLHLRCSFTGALNRRVRHLVS